jgi:DNA polymerase-3 subunit gamma/tau
MKNMNPTITEFPLVEVVVDNELIKQEIEDIQGSMSKTLQIYLHNNHLKLTVRVAEQKEKVKILSRKEQYDQMAEKNPAVKKLQQVFDLELA